MSAHNSTQLQLDEQFDKWLSIGFTKIVEGKISNRIKRNLIFQMKLIIRLEKHKEKISTKQKEINKKSNEKIWTYKKDTEICKNGFYCKFQQKMGGRGCSFKHSNELKYSETPTKDVHLSMRKSKNRSKVEIPIKRKSTQQKSVIKVEDEDDNTNFRILMNQEDNKNKVKKTIEITKIDNKIRRGEPLTEREYHKANQFYSRNYEFLGINPMDIDYDEVFGSEDDSESESETKSIKPEVKSDEDDYNFLPTDINKQNTTKHKKNKNKNKKKKK